MLLPPNTQSDNRADLFAREFLAGWSGSIGGLLVGYPMNTIKVRIQTEFYGDKDYRGLRILRKIMKHEGFLTLYKDCLTQVSSRGLVTALQFSTNESTNRAIQVGSR